MLKAVVPVAAGGPPRPEELANRHQVQKPCRLDPTVTVLTPDDAISQYDPPAV